MSTKPYTGQQAAKSSRETRESAKMATWLGTEIKDIVIQLSK